MRPLRRAARTWGLVVLLVAGLAVTVPLDATIHDLAFRYLVSHEVRLLSNALTPLGTAWVTGGLLGALAVVAHRTADAALLRASLGGLAGVAAAAAATHLVKQVTCRARPGLVEGWGVGPAPGTVEGLSWRAAAFGFFHWPCLADSRYQSFPSGHAASAFAVAATLVHAAPTRRRLWLAVAASVGASRVLLNAHFVSDVLGGALLGWWAGQLGPALAGRVLPWLRATAPPEVRPG